jgi:hypothetical protein
MAARLDFLGLKNHAFLLKFQQEQIEEVNQRIILLDGGGLLREGPRLEEGNHQLLLPENAVVFLVQVSKRVACFAVLDVR